MTQVEALDFTRANLGTRLALSPRMERTLFNDRLAEQENARFERATRAADQEAELAWARLLELASDRPGALIAIARARAPEAAARVLKNEAK